MDLHLGMTRSLWEDTFLQGGPGLCLYFLRSEKEESSEFKTNILCILYRSGPRGVIYMNVVCVETETFICCENEYLNLFRNLTNK